MRANIHNKHYKGSLSFIIIMLGLSVGWIDEWWILGLQSFNVQFWSMK